MGKYAYTAEEKALVEQYISKRYGRWQQIWEGEELNGCSVDVYVLPPEGEQGYYTFVTCGMGAYKMNVPPEQTQANIDRAELSISVPADWYEKDMEMESWWPVRWLRLLSSLPMEEESWLGWGHTICAPRDMPLGPGAPFNTMMLLNNGERDFCLLPDGSRINFFDLVPLYPEELDYKMQHSAEELLQLFAEDAEEIRLLPVDVQRKNVCAQFKKLYRIKDEDLQNLLPDWEGAGGCLATDRIMVDGCRVGLCYRVRPSENDKNWDSGWRFLAGDETDEYMSNADNYGVFAVNTLCNYDKELLALVRSPYGSAFARSGEDGGLQPVEFPVEMREAPASLLQEDDIARLQSYQDSDSGYFYKMAEYLDNFIERGVKEKRFTRTEAREDAELAMWYAYAWNNLDIYEYYYRTTQWMPASEKNAKGCGAWYYRYAVALMYCGKLLQALKYAEKGVVEDPDYPWGWLELAKMRYHFGNVEGALAAVDAGLALVPGDYEFITLQQEISEGCSLEQMEYHYINPDADRLLMEGQDEDADDKQISVRGILCDGMALQAIVSEMQLTDWATDQPYCGGITKINGQDVEFVFRMNAAYLSKMDKQWLLQQKQALTEQNYMLRRTASGKEYRLEVLFIYRNYDWVLVYIGPDENRVYVQGRQQEERLLLNAGETLAAVDACLEQAEQEEGEKE